MLFLNDYGCEEKGKILIVYRKRKMKYEYTNKM
jgi:hypothetical protein